MPNLKRIQCASRRLRRLLLVILFLIPIINTLVWIFINKLPTELCERIIPVFVKMPLPLSARLMGFAVTLLPTAMGMIFTYFLMQLFRLYEEGQIFRAPNVRCFRNLARVLLVWFVIGIIHQTLLSVVLTLHHPPGQRMITVGLSSGDLTTLLTGVILAVIAWVMDEGRKLQEDQDFTV
jgi:hypothetical protein